MAAAMTLHVPCASRQPTKVVRGANSAFADLRGEIQVQGLAFIRGGAAG
jgi:hypothetical protein